MARLPRYNLPGITQHIIIRSLNRQPVFNCCQDYRYYQIRLSQSLQRHQCALHAYVLMPDQVQLLITPSSVDGIPKLVQMLGRYYVQYFNKTYDRCGTIWEGRYRAAPVDTDNYLIQCCQYIETMPVLAGKAREISEYEWSSYRFHAGYCSDPLVTEHDIYRQLGMTGPERATSYRMLCSRPMQQTLVQEINCSIYNCWVLGSEAFKQRIARIVCRRVSPLPRGGDRKSSCYRE